MSTAEQARGQTVPSQFFVTGGTMRLTAPSYVKRDADTKLLSALANSDFCYVLDTRQMGKSSMMARAAKTLRDEGASVAVIDLQNLGQSVTVEQWYYAQLSRIGDALDLEDEVDDVWAASEKFSPVQRWVKTIKEVFLPSARRQLVIFVDEIDFVRSLPFPTDEFFAAIRGFYNERAIHPELHKLTFCLLGVATPTDLIGREDLTPFNVGVRIDLADFSEEEVVKGFRDGLSQPPSVSDMVLKRVWYWTAGHPYLTQKLSEACAEHPSVQSAEDVDKEARSLFLSAGNREQNDNLRFVANRLLARDEDIAGVLNTYDQIRRGKRVPNEANPIVNALRLSGIARVVDGKLGVRNPIYYEVFDNDWLDRNMPDRQKREQQAAIRRAQLKTAAVLILIGLVIGAIFWAIALSKQNSALKVSQDKLKIATELAQANEHSAKVQAELAKQERENAELAADRAHDAEVLSNTLKNEAEQKRIEAQKLADRYHELSQREASTAQEALEQKQRADAALNKAEIARADLEKSQQELQKAKDQLTQDKETASTLRLSARADVERNRPSSSPEPSVLLAIESLGRMWSIDNYPVLLKAMELTPGHKSTRKWNTAIPSKLSASPNGAVLVGEVDDKVCQWQFAPPKDVCFSRPVRDGKYYVSNDGRYIWVDAQSKVRYLDTTVDPVWVPLDLPASVQHFVPSPNGVRVAALENDRVMVRSFPDTRSTILAIVTRAKYKRVESSNRIMRPVQFSRDGRYLLNFEPDSDTGTYRLWDLDERREVFETPAAQQEATLGPDAESGFFKTDRTSGQLTRPEVPFQVQLARDRAMRRQPGLPSIWALLRHDSKRATTSKTTTVATVTDIRAIAYSPDGSLFAAATPDAAVVWQVARGAQSPLPQTEGVTDLAFSPDSSMLVATSKGIARVFDMRNYQELARVSHDSVIRAGFSADLTLVTVSKDRAEVWNATGWRAVAYLPRTRQTSRGVIFSPNSDAAAFFSGSTDTPIDYILTLRETSNGRVIRRLATSGTRIMASADGRRVAVPGNKEVLVLQVATGRELARIPVPDTWTVADFSPDGERILLVGANRYLRIVPLTGEPFNLDSLVRGTFFGFAGPTRVYSVSASAIQAWNLETRSRVAIHSVRSSARPIASSDGRLLFGVSRQRASAGPVWLWNLGSNRFSQTSWIANGSSAPVVSSNGEIAAFQTADGWTFYSMDNLEQLVPPQRDISNLVFDPSGGLAAFNRGKMVEILGLAKSTGASLPAPPGAKPLGFAPGGGLVIHSNTKFTLWDGHTGPEAKDLFEAKEYVRSAALTGDGRYTVTLEGSAPPLSTAPDVVRIMDLKLATSDSLPLSGRVAAAAFSPDGRYVAAAGAGGAVMVFDRSAKKQIEAIQLENGATGLAIDPKGRYLATSGGLTVKVQNLGERIQGAKSKPFDDRVLSIAFHPTRDALAVACADGHLHLVSSSLDDLSLVEISPNTRRIDFSPDGRWLAARSSDGLILFGTDKWDRVWEWKRPRMAGMAFSPANRYLAAYSDDALQIYDLQSRTAQPPPIDSPPSGVGFARTNNQADPDEKYLLIAGTMGVRVLQLPSMTEVGRLPVPGRVAAIGISPDGRYLATATANGEGSVTYWRPKELIQQACELLTRKSLTEDERKRYLVQNEAYVDFCANPDKIVR